MATAPASRPHRAPIQDAVQCPSRCDLASSVAGRQSEVAKTVAMHMAEMPWTTPEIVRHARSNDRWITRILPGQDPQIRCWLSMAL